MPDSNANDDGLRVFHDVLDAARRDHSDYQDFFQKRVEEGQTLAAIIEHPEGRLAQREGESAQQHILRLLALESELKTNVYANLRGQGYEMNEVIVLSQRGTASPEVDARTASTALAGADFAFLEEELDKQALANPDFAKNMAMNQYLRKKHNGGFVQV